MKNKILLISCSAVLLTFYSFKANDGVNNAKIEEVKSKPIDLANFNLAVKPGDDFYEYVNGGWLKRNPIPATETRWGSFNILDDATRNRVRILIDETAKKDKAEQGSAAQKIRDFYNTGMDSLRIEEMGSSPLIPMFQLVDNLKSKKDLFSLVSSLHKKGIGCFFRFYIGQDDKISTQMIVNLNQGGLGLPDKDYYLKNDNESVSIRQQYMGLIENLLNKAQQKGAAADEILKFETMLANASRSRVDLRDPEKNYNKMPLEKFYASIPEISLNRYFEGIGIQPEEVLVGQPEFFTALNKAVEATSLETIKGYLKWCIINDRAATLSREFVKPDFEFFQGVLSGAKEMKPRWKRVSGSMNGTMGELIGQLYVERYFTIDAKKRVESMVNNLTAAYKERIESRKWMNDITKKAALEKLEKVIRKLAYPDKWRDYNKLEVKTDSYCENVNRASEFWFNYNLDKLGKPVDKSEWGMSPQTINAYYNPGFNEIVFPAAIMQPPFFDPTADDAVNYGGMGAVIGHELTHGFDDQGSQYDAEGNLKNWWTDEDKARFKENTQKLVKQFNEFIAIDSLTVNGELTLGENIADLGGLTIAFAALKKGLAVRTGASSKIDGFTPEQRFFISYAQVWRNNIRPEELKKRLKTDPHSPGRFRTIGPLRNMPEFYEAFKVTPDNKMYLPVEQRAEIW
jgi:putative endopeptidase